MPLVTGPDGRLYADWRTENAATAATRASSTPTPPRPTRPVVVRNPTREQFGTPSREGIDTLRADMDRFRGEYADPRSSTRFRDLFGAGTTSLARAREETIRQGQEAASRRGYTGGFSGAQDEARRAYEQNRARLGFDAANQVADTAAGLYDSAAGKFANLVTAYNEQLGAGDRQYGDAVQAAREAYRQGVYTFRGQQEDARQFDTTFTEGQRRYDLTRQDDLERFRAEFGQRAHEYEATLRENQRQFNEGQKLSREELKAQAEDRELQRALQLAEALGLDPRLLVPTRYLRGAGGRSQISR